AVPAAKPVLDPPWALGIHFAPEVAVDSLRPVDVVLPADPGLDLADHAVSPMLELVDAAPVALNLRHALLAVRRRCRLSPTGTGVANQLAEISPAIAEIAIRVKHVYGFGYFCVAGARTGSQAASIDVRVGDLPERAPGFGRVEIVGRCELNAGLVSLNSQIEW